MSDATLHHVTDSLIAAAPDALPAGDEALIAQMLPILNEIHRRALDGLPDAIASGAVSDAAKAVFEGALYMHDRARLQDFAGLENHAREVAIDAVITLVLIRQRRANLDAVAARGPVAEKAREDIQ